MTDSIEVRRCNGNRLAWIAVVSRGCLALSFTAMSLDSLVARIAHENPNCKQIKVTL
jgi:hypothetical protein